MAAFAGLKAFSNRREQRSSQMRHPVHFEASTLIGGAFLRVIKVSFPEIGLSSFFCSEAVFKLSFPTCSCRYYAIEVRWIVPNTVCYHSDLDPKLL